MGITTVTSIVWLISLANDLADLWRGTHPTGLNEHEEAMILRSVMRSK